MITLFKSKDTKLFYIETVAFGSPEDFFYVRDEDDLFTIDRKNTKVIEVNKAPFDIFVGLDEAGEKIEFASPDEFEDYLIEELKVDEMIDREKLSKTIESTAYNPTVIISTSSMAEKPINQTFNQIILGEFIDAITSVSISSSDDEETGVEIVSKTFSELKLSITTNSIIQTYTLTFKKGDVVIGTLDFESAALELITPSRNGFGEALWRQPNPLPANNEVVLGDGRFESEQNNGEGWNNHAYYGNFQGSFTKIVHEMTHNNTTNAYCYIKFNNTTNVGTSGNPRIYIQNGNSLRIYSNTGAQIATRTIAAGDRIVTEFTATSMRVSVNGTQVVLSNGDYSNAMQGSYVTFTSYRFSILTDILTKLID